ncbi:MAG: mannose-1-phosphate guanylyltransferase/mannose-6-phosphate isomerase [Candidatus Adiutrix sp.]|jgi:mannose-1-phosphate guanylyltransferase|nr:mannose-1-phosphate guanylyltransferase/mannose-6-phosphate isomerase [Candidatus Adiutrix sp.]
MISVILCGGAGSRLWPLSRESYPKPFITLPDGQSLIQKAFQRAEALPGTTEILTVTNRALQFQVDREIKVAGIRLKTSCILEPFGRNTAPAIAAAALDLSARYGEDVELLILTADHLIADQESFRLAVDKALDLARQGQIVTFGIQPQGPETGFGYIEAEGSRIRRFVEKPTLEKAREYLAAAGFYWNSGMFCGQARVILAELAHHAPDLLAAVERCLSSSSRRREGEILELNEALFAEVPGISIDYALMEKSDRTAVVPCDIGWSDIGSWTELNALRPADSQGNHVQTVEEAVLMDTDSCDIYSEDRLVATLGLTNLLIVDTPDALLVADKGQAQEVKAIYGQLKSEGREVYKTHRTVTRPWGSFTLLENGPRFKIKKLIVSPGSAISLQLHHHRSEHWIVVSGLAEVTRDEEVFFVDTNESTYIKAGHQHRVANRGIIDLVIIEVQSGDYLGEDDIVRFDDIYGRTFKAGPCN